MDSLDARNAELEILVVTREIPHSRKGEGRSCSEMKERNLLVSKVKFILALKCWETLL